MPATEGRLARDIDRELSGLDALEIRVEPRRPWTARAWSATWPKLAARHGPRHLAGHRLVRLATDLHLPGPAEVFSELWGKITDGTLAEATATTMRRATTGYTLALVVGTLLGAAVASPSCSARRCVADHRAPDHALDRVVPPGDPAVRALEAAILFVVIIGAAPSVANGLIAGSISSRRSSCGRRARRTAVRPLAPRGAPGRAALLPGRAEAGAGPSLGGASWRASCW